LIPKCDFCILVSQKIPQNVRNLKKLVIAIDGPAASGKSTTSKLTAKRLGYLHVDTGAMYRAMTLKIIESGIDVSDTIRIAEVAQKTAIRLEDFDDELKIFLDGRDVTKSIRSQAVTKNVSAVSALKDVREVMVREQRQMGKNGGIVLEGRDIGTVVFPDADVKIFMVAHVEERARRRAKELEKQGIHIPLEQLVNEIIERDQKDSQRDISPLRKADDAHVLDTSNLTIEEQVDFIVTIAKELIHQEQ
jgi:cytidylate kinase